MANFSFISYKLFPSVLNMSITASVAVIVLIVFRYVCRYLGGITKKIPTVVFYSLWVVVLFRLLCPFSITSDKSFFQQYDSPINRTGENVSVMEYVPTDIVHTEYPAVDLPADFLSHIVNHYMPQGEEQLRADPLETPVAIATNIWFIGIFVMGMYGFHSYINLKKKLIGAVRLKENIYICDYISSPFVIGTVKPKIYLPSTLNENETEYVIAHEKYHIKRFDHIFKLLAFIALTLHWFNPFVWAMYILFNRDIELSCDESVVRRFGENMKSYYAKTLITMEEKKSGLTPLYNSFSRNAIEERISAIMKTRKLTIGILVVSIFVIAAIVVLFATSAKNPEKETQSTDENVVKQESVQGETGEMEIGMVSEAVTVTGTPLEMAKEVVSEHFAKMQENGYVNWRIDSLTEEYKYGPNEEQSLDQILPP